MRARRGVVTEIHERMAAMPLLIVECEPTSDMVAHLSEVAGEERCRPGGMMGLQKEAIIVALFRQLEQFLRQRASPARSRRGYCETATGPGSPG
jgi:hypothetical protein